jgi:hypothetical protein
VRKHSAVMMITRSSDPYHSWLTAESVEIDKIALEVLAVSPDSIHIVQRIRQLLDQQIRTTMSALGAPSGSPDWRSYGAVDALKRAA